MIIILSGPVHSGKTTLLEGVVAALKKKSVAVDGYLVPFRRPKENQAEGYDLVSLRDGSRFPFLGREANSGAVRAGSFYLSKEGLVRAEEIIRNARDSSLLVVDEVGPLELAGGGVRGALDEALAVRTGATLLVVRESILDEALESLDIAGARIIDVREPGAGAELLKRLENPQSR